MNIRFYTNLIVYKDGKYLQGYIIGLNELKWSDSPWDAWMTRERADAYRVAHAVKGELFLFNPIVGQIRRYEYGKQ